MRQKKVFAKNELFHVWANQLQSEGRSTRNVFFDGATIYSYGRHFPIATIEGDYVLFTIRTYSNTTSKHTWETREAVSHKKAILCYEVPVKYSNGDIRKEKHDLTHSANLDYWKYELKRLIVEIGNKRNRNITGRVQEVTGNVGQLMAYVEFFGIKIKDKELNGILKMVASPEFVEKARGATQKDAEKRAIKMAKAEKVVVRAVAAWREGRDKDEVLNNKDKELIRFYHNNSFVLTRLRYNPMKMRVETSKGVEIPVVAAFRAYKAINGCMNKVCRDLDIPVMGYTITESTKDSIIAGCHTIPKEDVRYIADLLGWDKYIEDGSMNES